MTNIKITLAGGDFADIDAEDGSVQLRIPVSMLKQPDKGPPTYDIIQRSGGTAYFSAEINGAHVYIDQPLPPPHLR